MDPAAPPSQPSFAAIVVAAGKGLRAGGDVPKQFALWRGKPVVRHPVEALLAAGASAVVVAIPEGAESIAQAMLAGLDRVRLVTGGDTRQTSVKMGLEALEKEKPDHVLIHDAARPAIPSDVIDRLMAALETSDAVIPVLPVIDSIAIAEGQVMAGSADREMLRRVQTPQAFRFAAILAAHRAWQGDAEAGDDAQVAAAAGMEVSLVPGHEDMRKITLPQDLNASTLHRPLVRTGTGFDVHRLGHGHELWLCGVRIEHERGLVGHSDADVAIHALVDALFGAIGEGDIGSHFPPSDPQWKGAPSDRFLAHAATCVARAGYAISNVDVTIICEAPRIGPHREAMRQRLAQVLAVDTSAVSVKATTTERLGFTGREEGIAAQAVATLCRNE